VSIRDWISNWRQPQQDPWKDLNEAVGAVAGAAVSSIKASYEQELEVLRAENEELRKERDELALMRWRAQELISDVYNLIVWGSISKARTVMERFRWDGR